MSRISRIIALASLTPLAAGAVEFGTLKVTQIANNNNPISDANPGISIAYGPGTTTGGIFTDGANRGDYNMDFGRSSDTGSGVLISSTAQWIRNDSAKGGPATGDFNATSSFGFNATSQKYWIAVHWAEVVDNEEANYDVSYAYLPYDEFIGGYATNDANNGALTQFTGTAGLSLGTNLTDPTENNGTYSLNLAPLVTNAAQNGVLLVTGAKNEDNYALSQANADGTFTIYCHDNGANVRTYENDGVGFSYLPTSAVGTKRLVALGRVNGNASTDVAAGSFTVTKGTTGRWYLQIPGHNQTTGTLIVSPEGGDTNNVDNIVSAAWDPANSRWIIESRDLTGTAPQTPGLQNMANDAEDAFSFAFFALNTANQPPTASQQSPADNAIKVPVNAPLTVQTTDPENQNLTVRYYARRVAAVEPSDQFSVVALPDTQFYSENTGGDRAAIFSAQTDWIVAERDARNIGFVLHLGDISQNGDNPTTALEQWTNASNAMYRLEDPLTTMQEEGVPYIMAVGNHDQTPIGDADGTTTNFNKYFGVHPDTGINHFADKSYYGGTSETAKADNNYTLFTAGGMDFIVISFEYDTTPDTADLNWADALLKAHPTRRGIVITHHMVNTGNPASFSGQGSAIYEALKDNPNLILTHGGHVHGEGRRSDTYQGRTVHSLLADYQGRSNGGDGWLRIMTFRPSLNKIEVQSYSPTLDQFETDADSQFSLTVDLKSGMGPHTQVGHVTTAPGATTFTWNGLEAGTRYEWYATVSDGENLVTTPVRSFVTDGVLFDPTAELTGPANGTLVASPANLTLQATAADIDGTVSKVQFYNGTTLLGEDSAAPYTYAWNGVTTGNYAIIAKAVDNDGNTGSSAPISIQVVTEPAAPDPSTASAGLFNPTWTVAATSSSPRQFNNPGTNLGDVELKINGTAPAFLAGVTAATNWENAGGPDALDNLPSPYASGTGKAWVNVVDNTNNNASDANPTTAEESAGVAVTYLPYASGWIGASVDIDANVLGGNLPAGVEVHRVGDGIYAISGLALSGNLLAFPNGNSGTDADNVLSVRTENGKWLVDLRDNSSEGQNGPFSFVYVPAATPGVLSGMIKANGTHTRLNAELESIGATSSKAASYFQITFGDGSVINPSNSAMFLCGDSTSSGTAAENIVSYSSSGNAFRVFSQDLPQLSGSFQATDIRFLVVPFSFTGAQMPQASVSATKASGGEYGEDRTLEFTFGRSGSLDQAMSLAYSTGGTAVAGIDFTALPGVVTIPAGEASATVPVEIRADAAAEGDETIVLSVIEGEQYSTSAPASAVATIKDRPLHAYLHASGVGAAEGDDDGDGMPNLLEYFMGTEAGTGSSVASLAAIARGDGSFAARFPHAKSASDLSSAVEWSSDLTHWYRSGESDGQRTATISTQRVSPENEDPETLEAVLTVTSGPALQSVYLRLAVTP